MALSTAASRNYSSWSLKELILGYPVSAIDGFELQNTTRKTSLRPSGLIRAPNPPSRTSTSLLIIPSEETRLPAPIASGCMAAPSTPSPRRLLLKPHSATLYSRILIPVILRMLKSGGSPQHRSLDLSVRTARKSHPANALSVRAHSGSQTLGGKFAADLQHSIHPAAPVDFSTASTSTTAAAAAPPPPLERAAGNKSIPSGYLWHSLKPPVVSGPITGSACSPALLATARGWGGSLTRRCITSSHAAAIKLQTARPARQST